MPYGTFNDEQRVRQAISRSNSMKECLIELGLRAAGGNYKGLIAACQKFGIEIKRGTGEYQLRAARLFQTKPSDEILVKNSKYTNRTRIKKRLLAEGLVENVCAHCGQSNTWNDKPLTLQLEHINGVYNDHRVENLCLLCPNCHSQTANFAGRNTSKVNRASRFASK